MDKKYCIDTKENKEFFDFMTKDLLGFGVKFPSPGGGSYYLGDDGTPWTDRPRETWITCRMTHVYSIGSMLGFDTNANLADKVNPTALELAQAGLKGLLGELKDSKNGGWYAGLTKDNTILPLKQCYAHAFVILAVTSAYLAGIEGAKALLDEALEVYDKYFWLDDVGLACDTWDTDFKLLDDYRGINANMHTVEAFLAVADVTGNEEYRVRAGRIIDHVIGWASNNNWRVPEHFTSNWEMDLDRNKEKPDDPFKPYGATCGHGIEWARLITQWALSAYRDDKAKSQPYVVAACKLYNKAIADGWYTDENPGIVYTTDWNGKPVVRDRMHWTLCEAINSSAVLYRVTGEAKYANDFAMFNKYLDESVLDHVNGSWFHQLDENNKLKGTVWPGKSDLYHALQATLIPYNRVDLSIAAAIKEKFCEG